VLPAAVLQEGAGNYVIWNGVTRNLHLAPMETNIAIALVKHITPRDVIAQHFGGRENVGKTPSQKLKVKVPIGAHFTLRSLSLMVFGALLMRSAKVEVRGFFIQINDVGVTSPLA